MYIFFDTETNGLPKNYKASVTELDNWPRVIQFAWITLNEDMKTFTENKYFIKPDGWTKDTLLSDVKTKVSQSK